MAAFERLHQLTVTVHDLSGYWLGMIDPKRIRHRHPVCVRVKTGPQAACCPTFEVDHLRPNLLDMPAGRVHRCHAGVVEWVVPMINADRLLGVVFAGARRWLGPATPAIDEQRWQAPGVGRLPGVTAADAVDLLEATRQLAARLTALVAAQVSTQPAPPSRRAVIRQHVEHHAHTDASLSSLAKRLGVGPDRCSHVVREVMGQSWTALVQAQRLRVACQLLTTTDLPLAAIAERAGFGAGAVLGRVFKRSLGVTPGRWRRQANS